jgi:hypothetical protein
MGSNRRLYRDYTILIAAIAVSYFNSLWGSFQFDDFNVIVTNENVHSLSAWLYKSLHGGIRPLLNVTYTLNWVSGLGITGYHLTNILIHLVTTLLVYRICEEFIEQCLGNGCVIRQKEIVPLLTALLFAVHPIQTESVTYLSGRSASLMAMFYLASMLAYLHAVKSGRAKWNFIISPALFVAAVSTKEIAVSLPLVLLLWEKIVARTPLKLALRRQVLHWLLLMLLMAVILTHPRYLRLLFYSLEIRSFHDTLIGQFNGITYMMGQLFRIGSMNIDPDFDALSKDMVILTRAAVISWCLCAVYAVRHSKQKPWLAFGLFWVALVLLPGNSIIPRTDSINERHLYLANVGIFLVFVILVMNLEMLREAHSLLLMGGISVVLTGFTIHRNSDYRSEIALWEQTARLSPAKSRVFNNLGCAYEVAGMYEKAKLEYIRALHLKADNKIASDNLKRLSTRLERTLVRQ